MNVFISQPMNGKTENEINDVRVEIISKLEKKLGVGYGDIYVVNAFDYGTEMPSRLVMLGRSIEAMAEADVIVFVEGFSAASGCLVEHEVAMSYINTDEFENKRVYFERRGNIVKARNRTDIYKGYEYDAHHNTRATDSIQNELDGLRDRVKELEDECDQQAEDNKKLSLALKDREEKLDRLRNDYDILAKDYETLNDAHKGLLKEHDHVIKVRDARIRENKRLTNDIINVRHDFKDLYERYDDLKERYNKLEHCNESLQNELTMLREKIRDYRIQANSVYGLCQPRGFYRDCVYAFPYTRYDKMVIQADNGLYVSDIKYKDGECEYDGFYTTDCKLSSVSYCIDIKDAKVYTDWPEAVCDRRQLNRIGSRDKRTWFSIKEFTF